MMNKEEEEEEESVLGTHLRENTEGGNRCGHL